jgi:hypothetical protein
MTAHAVLSIEPTFATYRVLLSDGHVIDVRTPNRLNSDDRAQVLADAAERWGKADRKIEGTTHL